MDFAENRVHNFLMLRRAVRVDPELAQPILMPEVARWRDEGDSGRVQWPFGAIHVEAPAFVDYLLMMGVYNINEMQQVLNRLGALFRRPNSDPMDGALLLELVVDNWWTLFDSPLTHRSLESRFVRNLWT